MKPLKIEDFIPQPAVFTLQSMPTTPIKLKKWSLRVKAWAIGKYGLGEVQKIMSEMKIVQVAEITFFMMEDESQKLFGHDLDKYLEAISGVADELAVHKALLQTVGVGEVEIEKLSQLIVESVKLPDPKKAAPKPKKSK